MGDLLQKTTLPGTFPGLAQTVNGAALAYLDNAATTHMPLAVLEAMREFETTSRANIHRGVHTLSQRATDAYERAREGLKRFIGAGPSHELVFTSGTTEALNLVAHGLSDRAGGPSYLRPRDEIIVSGLEHHANLVPWQQAARRSGATLRILRPDAQGPAARRRPGAAAHAAHDGVRGDGLRQRDRRAPALRGPARPRPRSRRPHGARRRAGRGARDAAARRAWPATSWRSRATRCTARWASARWPDRASRSTGWRRCGWAATWWTGSPSRRRASPNCRPGSKAARRTWPAPWAWPRRQRSSTASAAARSTSTCARCGRTRWPGCPRWTGVTVLSPHAEQSAIVSFVAEGAHPHDLGTLLDERGIAVRTGHHCAQPLLDHLGVGPTTRASFALYNTHDDVERLVAAVAQALEVLR